MEALVGNMEGILCSDWLSERATWRESSWAHLACSGLPALISRNKQLRGSDLQSLKLLNNGGDRFAKSRRGQSKQKNINDSREPIVLQTELAFFPGSRNEQVVLDCY